MAESLSYLVWPAGILIVVLASLLMAGDDKGSLAEVDDVTKVDGEDSGSSGSPDCFQKSCLLDKEVCDV